MVALGSLVFGRSSIVALFGLLGVAITLFGS